MRKDLETSPTRILRFWDARHDFGTPGEFVIALYFTIIVLARSGPQIVQPLGRGG